ncbi:Mediator complex subunit 2 family protein [Candida albicans]|uniref:Mediator complex subunit 2 family protein n=1 Tax=Candida albicans TaxID=5476 RepID=A0A8H6C648_CANAX|nr:Mediator complex subunit 2 family protein [Candida albicans]
MPENLQTRLHNSLDEILKSSGYIFEKKKLDELKVKEEEAKKKEEEAKKRKKRPRSKAEEAAPQKFDNFDDFIGFDINDNTNDEDILSNMDYEDLKLDDKVPATTDQQLGHIATDMNNILENDESILDGLNMTLLDNGDHVNEEFDVDSFLNQFGN